MITLRLTDKKLIVSSLYSLVAILALAAVAYTLARPQNPIVLGLSSVYNP